MSNSDLVRNYSRPASDPPRTTGIWRGVVTSINASSTGYQFEFSIPRLSGSFFTYPAEVSLVSKTSLTVGDEILVAFMEGRNDEIAVLGKVV